MIKQLKAQGMYIKDIAAAVDRDRKTVSKWLNSDSPPVYEQKMRGSKLDEYKDYIRRRMEEGCNNSNVIYEEISAIGYTGKPTILREFMKPLRKSSKIQAFRRFETKPGQQAQVDWGTFSLGMAGRKIKVKAFVMILGYSRKMYCEFVENETFESLIACHVRAFEYFGGIPEYILYDNMRTVVKHDGKKKSINQRFQDFARHMNFKPVLCRKYHPQTKGKVENGVKYVRRNFWPRIRSINSLHALNLSVANWLEKTANIRIHGTTHERPNDRFENEINMLKSIPKQSYLEMQKHKRKVYHDCFLTFETCRYSVPWKYVGKEVFVKDLRDGRLEISDNCGMIIEIHEKSLVKNQTVKIKKHFQGLASADYKVARQPIPEIIAKEESPEVFIRKLDTYEALAHGGDETCC